MTDSADPLNGWHYSEYLPHAQAAKEDVYGALFFFVKQLLQRFCDRLRTNDILFRLYNVDASELPKYLTPRDKPENVFDRIEVRFLLHFVCPMFLLEAPEDSRSSKRRQAALIDTF
jgi:hypothetical protein